jgi:hypothetical protein
MQLFNKRMLKRLQLYNFGYKLNRMRKLYRCKMIDYEMLEKIQSNIILAMSLYNWYWCCI